MVQRFTSNSPKTENTYGDRIKSARKAADLTQEQLGQLIHCSQKVISALETGLREPFPSELRAIGAACNIDWMELLG